MTTLGYNLTTPAGRAIHHILEKSSLSGSLGAGIEITNHGEHGRMLETTDVFDAMLGSGEGTLMCLVESLAGQTPIILAHIFGVLDDPNRQVAAESLWLAAGFEYLGVTS